MDMIRVKKLWIEKSWKQVEQKKVGYIVHSNIYWINRDGYYIHPWTKRYNIFNFLYG